MKVILKTFLVLFAMTSIGACNPLKVTDPNNPNFDPDKFSFSDYYDHDAKLKTFKELFPLGTPKSFVDRVLVDAGGAKVTTASNELAYVWRYSEPQSLGYPAGPVHIFIYNEKDELQNIVVSAHTYLYESPTLEDISQ